MWHPQSAFVTERRSSDRDFDIVIPQMGATGDAKADIARMQDFAEAGATWILDAAFPGSVPLDEIMARVRRGPPQIDC